VHAVAKSFQLGNKSGRVDGLPRPEAKDILPGPGNLGGSMELFAFDRVYVERLRDGDSATEKHFVSYFEQLLHIKLRARMLPCDVVRELRQETFSRLFVALRREGGIRQPERLGAFVNSICNNVLSEHYRSSIRNQPMDDAHLEIPDKALNLEGMLASQETVEQVRAILNELPKRDRDVLRAIFLEERTKDEVCAEFGVDREYLRVVVHRAKSRFKSVYEKEQPTGVGRPVGALKR
jgi:RNA polymerase sigma-70 factor, ECF subfamily